MCFFQTERQRWRDHSAVRTLALLGFLIMVLWLPACGGQGAVSKTEPGQAAQRAATRRTQHRRWAALGVKGAARARPPIFRMATAMGSAVPTTVSTAIAGRRMSGWRSVTGRVCATAAANAEVPTSWAPGTWP